MTVSDEMLQSKGERSQQKFELLTDGWETVPEERRRKLYGGIGQKARSAGIYSTLSGDDAAGSEWLRRSFEWIYEPDEREQVA